MELATLFNVGTDAPPRIHGAARVLATEHQERARDILEQGPVAWIVRKFVTNTLFTALYIILLPAFLGDGFRIDPASAGFWLRVLACGVIAVPFTWWSFRTMRRQAGLSREDMARSIVRDWNLVSAPGWFRRTLLMGLGLGFAIGVPVGLFVALGFPEVELFRGSRPLTFVNFVALTLGWTLPMSFLIRFLSIRFHPLARAVGADTRSVSQEWGEPR